MSNNQKFNEAKDRLITSAQRVAGAYLLSRYGSAHITGEPKVELTAIEGPTSSSFVFSGSITCYAADSLLNQVGVNMTVNENDIEVTSEDVQANITDALNAAEDHPEHVVASLDGFKLLDDGTTYLKVSHRNMQDASIGIVGKNEYATSKDRSALLQGILKDAVLNTPVTFTGEFKEPVIEKASIVVIASEKVESKKKTLCETCEGGDCDTWGCSGHDEKTGVDCGCTKCSSLVSKKQPKKSWLTASLFKKADEFKFEQPDSRAYEPSGSEDPEPYADSEQLEENENYVLWQTPYADHTTYWVSDKEGAELAAFDTIEEAQNAMATGQGLEMLDEASLGIKEDMPMARAADHIAQEVQSEDQSMLAAQLKVEHEAANQLISVLQGMGYGTAKTVEITSSKEGFDIMTAIDDAGAVKAVSIPVTIKEGKVILPKKALISTLISKGLDVQAKLAEQFDLEVLEKLAAIEERMVYESAEAEAILSEKPVTKQAAGEKQPFFDSDDSTLTVQKHLLPNHEDLKRGDKISDGTDQYEIVNTDGAQNSKGEGDSSLWTLKKCQAPERDNKEVKNQIPS